MMSAKVKNRADCIFVIDAGTQSIRAAIVDLHGAIRDIVKTPIEPYFQNIPGGPNRNRNITGKSSVSLVKNY